MRHIGKALKRARFKDVTERFWRRTKWQENGCREWQGAQHEFGYGVVGIGKQTLKTHRVAWWLTNGPIPEGMQVLHKCDNPPCVNPEHLFLGTDLDNQRDAMQKGRHSKPPVWNGAANPAAKLAPNNVKMVRRMLSVGYTHRQIARIFGVTKSTIGRIARGTHWRTA